MAIDKTIRLPATESVERAMELAANDPLILEHIRNGLESRMRLAGIADKEDALLVLGKIDDAVEVASAISETRNAGRAFSLSNFEVTSPQDTIADSARDKLYKALSNEDKKQQISVDIAVSDLAEILRGYSINGEPLPPELAELMDEMLNGWFSENNLVSSKSVIYVQDGETGHAKTDSKGKRIKADADKVRKVLEGFEKYMKSKGFDAEVKLHEFPQKPEKKPAAQQQAVQQEVHEEVKPTTPTGGAGA